MTGPDGPVTLRLATGSGHVARRPTAVLFLPEPDPALLAAFHDGRSGAELQAIASATVAAGFDVARYVALSWSGGTVRVMAFGDVAVETDQPTLPMLSGAGSWTWVEHTLAPAATATITVAGDGLDPTSDLRDGVAPAGGFRLELAAMDVDAVEQVDVDADEPAAPPPADELPAPVGVPAELPDPTAAVVRPEQDPPPTPSPEAPPAIDPDDPHAALAAIQAAAMGEDGAPLHAPAPPAVTAPSSPERAGDADADPDATLPPPDVGELLEDLAAPRSGRSSLLDAKLCSHGHANPPTVATCSICGELLSPGSGSLVHISRPRLGALRLDDGSLVPLDDELLIGRNPTRDEAPARAGLERVTVAGEKVSRSHLEVRFQGWDVLVADCGSTNGTFIVPHPGGQVVALDAGRPQLVEPGATVYFGSRSFTVLGRQDP